jgi:hypothetical protein
MSIEGEIIDHVAVAPVQSLQAKIKSDAKVIADMRRRLEDTAYPLGEIEGLMKEIAALREALERIVELNPAIGHLECVQTKIARAALGTYEQIVPKRKDRTDPEGGIPGRS